MHTGLVHSLDFDRDGKTLDFLGIPFSVDRSPYYQVKIPICLIRNGEGPSVLLMAGNHGDEYEGELSLARLIRRLDPASIRGTGHDPADDQCARRHGCQALLAARRRQSQPRLSGQSGRYADKPPCPFPGEPSSFPAMTWCSTSIPGGTSMEHLPTALVERNLDPERNRRGVDLMRMLGMPHGFIADNGAASPTSMGAARRAGAIGVSGEFGGGGTATADSMAITARAIDRLLVATGSIEAPLLAPDAEDPAPTQLLSLSRHSQGIFATRRGWFEPVTRLGQTVSAGDLAGWYHDLERLDLPEEPLRFAEAGIIISRRLHTMCEAGDCLMQVAEPVAG